MHLIFGSIPSNIIIAFQFGLSCLSKELMDSPNVSLPIVGIINVTSHIL